MRPFTYVRADDAIRASRAMGQGSAFLAGGTTLLDLMKLDVLRPETLVDINGLRGASPAVAVTSGGLRLSAFASMAQVADDPNIRRDYPVIAQSLVLAASAQLRNMATLGGNVLQRTRCNYFRDPSWRTCNKREPGSGCAALDGVNRKHAVLGTSDHCIATYAGDFAQALVALDATVETIGPGGPRVMKFEALHRLPGRHSANRNELGSRRAHHRFHRAAHFMDAALALPQDPRPGVLRIRARFGGRCSRHGRKNGEGSAHRAGRHRDKAVARPGGGTGACRKSLE